MDFPLLRDCHRGFLLDDWLLWNVNWLGNGLLDLLDDHLLRKRSLLDRLGLSNNLLRCLGDADMWRQCL